MNNEDVLAKQEEELLAEIAQKKKELKLIRRILKRDKPIPKTRSGQYPLGLAEKYAKDIDSTFYKILKWDVETMRVLGKRKWYDCLGYIRGIRVICTYLEELNPDIPDDEHPVLPTLTGVTLDMENTKWVEVEASVIK